MQTQRVNFLAFHYKKTRISGPSFENNLLHIPYPFWYKPLENLRPKHPGI